MWRLLLLVIVAGVITYFVPAPAVHHEANIEVDGQRTQVWKVVSDLNDLPRWNANAQGIQFASSQRQGVGVEFSIPGQPFTHGFRVIGWEPYNKMQFRVTTKPALTVDHIMLFSLHTRGQKTIVRYIEEYRMKGGYLGYILDQVYYSAVRRKGRTPALANLKRFVETGQGMFLP